MKPVRVFVAVVALAAAASAYAEPAAALLQKVEDRMYFPQDHGLKDLKAMLTMEQAGAPPMPGMGFRLYWKAPDKRACRMQLPDELRNSPQGAMIAEMMEEQIGAQMNSVVALIVPDKYAGRQDEYDFTAEPDGALTKISGKRKADAKPDAGRAETIVMWVDAKATPVRVAMTMKGKASELTDLRFEERAGKLMLKSAAQKDGGQETGLSFEYAETGPVWLAKKVNVKTPQGDMAMVVNDLVVNEGVDDAVFAPPKKKAAPGE